MIPSPSKTPTIPVQPETKGTWGRRFKSAQPDKEKPECRKVLRLFFYSGKTDFDDEGRWNIPEIKTGCAAQFTNAIRRNCATSDV